ncbi:hypothetical protein HIM_11915 [Hirsutella minnesotensis 3608]|uniref:Uncharacterized protein n=1 Tax=Hirsutella minnesotensis 3608 TaxID=1043627 RepID=A0A0F7ZF85_9HYPO|nr:hypothetical protein HIM_11915 [Hirsutella minnesotensis 3608]
MAKDLDGVRLPKQAERFVHGQSRMDWQEKDVLVIDEQFRPVQERSVVLPSAAIPWDIDNSFKAEQQHQHDKAYALWKRFTTVVMLDEQMRAGGDPDLQRLLKRIRLGVQDHMDLDLLKSRCYREERRIPWETGITVTTPPNRNRWNLNMEASLAFRVQQRSMMRIFISEHKWKEELPTEEEAIMILNQGDDSAIPVPAVFMFVAGMPIVVNHNTRQGLKLVNGASYSAVEVIVDKAYPGHRISANMTIHFAPPAGIILESETTRCLHFVGMPPGTISVDTHDRQDTVPAEKAVATQRRQPTGFAVRSSVRVHGLQGAGQNAGARGPRAARDTEDEDRWNGVALAVRPVQPVRAAIALPNS